MVDRTKVAHTTAEPAPSTADRIFLLHSHETERDIPEEIEAAREVFGAEYTGTNLALIPAGSVVIPRYRAIPFGRELEEAISSLGSRLLNTYREHRNLANLFNWAYLLEGLTAPAYTLDDIPYLPEGSYFLKGETNSVKNNWNDKAYAATKADVPRIVHNLTGDAFVGSQEIVIRPFQPFRQLTTAVDGRPVFHERRVFTLHGQVLSEAFYWSSQPEVANTSALDPTAYETTLHEAIERVAHLAPFLVLDLAENEDGTWQVVELNDGCMSGLSDNDPHTLWTELQRVHEAK